MRMHARRDLRDDVRSRRARARPARPGRRNTPRSSPAALNSTIEPRGAHREHTRKQQRPVEVQRLEQPPREREGALRAARIPRSCDLGPHSSPPAAGAGTVAASSYAGLARAAAGRHRTPRARSGPPSPLPLRAVFDQHRDREFRRFRRARKRRTAHGRAGVPSTSDSLYCSCWPTLKTWAVPVLPAILYGAPAWLRRAVPVGSFVTPIMPPMITSQCAGSLTSIEAGAPAAARGSHPCSTLRMRLTSRGAIALATRLRWSPPSARAAAVSRACSPGRCRRSPSRRGTTSAGRDA